MRNIGSLACHQYYYSWYSKIVCFQRFGFARYLQCNKFHKFFTMLTELHWLIWVHKTGRSLVRIQPANRMCPKMSGITSSKAISFGITINTITSEYMKVMVKMPQQTDIGSKSVISVKPLIKVVGTQNLFVALPFHYELLLHRGFSIQ